MIKCVTDIHLEMVIPHEPCSKEAVAPVVSMRPRAHTAPLASERVVVGSEALQVCCVYRRAAERGVALEEGAYALATLAIEG